LRLEIVGIEIRHLLGGNLGDLIVADRTDGLASGELAPFSRPAASRMRNGVGGVLRTKVNERSS